MDDLRTTLKAMLDISNPMRLEGPASPKANRAKPVVRRRKGPALTPPKVYTLTHDKGSEVYMLAMKGQRGIVRAVTIGEDGTPSYLVALIWNGRTFPGGKLYRAAQHQVRPIIDLTGTAPLQW